MIYAVLLNFGFVAKFMVKNLNKDFTNTTRGGGGTFLGKFFEKFRFFLTDGFPYSLKLTFGGQLAKIQITNQSDHFCLFILAEDFPSSGIADKYQLFL